MNRLRWAWRELGPEQRFAGVAAFSLLLSMFLPWYQQNAVDRAGIVSQDLNAFAVFSFPEATILLVALGVMGILFLRAENRLPPAPGRDGAFVLAGGAWATFVLFLRLFDKPGVESHGIAANVGVQWGIFFALAAAGLLTYAGLRMQAMRQRPPLILAARARASDAAWTDAGGARTQADRSQHASSPVREVTARAEATSDRERTRTARPSRSRFARGASSSSSVAPPSQKTTSLQLSFDDDEAAPNGETPGEV